MNRYLDWLKQAEEDLKAAADSINTGHYEWACFQAQQSAEKSMKALLLYINLEVWGQGLVKIWKTLRAYLEKYKDIKLIITEKEYSEILDKCMELDHHYIQTRYPNGFASGYPAEYYNKKKAEDAIKYAGIINRFVKNKIEALSPSG